MRQSQREKEAKENPGPQDSQPKDTDKGMEDIGMAYYV